MKIIYRKKDRLIAGYVFARRDEKADNVALSVELENVLNSELGGKAEDYGFIVCQDDLLRSDHFIELDTDLKPVLHESLHSKHRRAAIQKLTKLGLTEAEIRSLG